MNLDALPAFADNYIWMLHDGQRAIVVDPGDAPPVHAALDAARLELAGILVTHYHGDHVGGLAALLDRLRGPIYAPEREAMPVPVTGVCGGARVELLGIGFDVIDVPGHTSGHIAFFAPSAGERPLLFCGDTLFSGGCGRLFEGTPKQMHDSLARLAALPSDTRVCCAHEYTLSNLRFARAAEPDNADLQRYQAECDMLRANGQATLPSTIGLERLVNPFLRSSEPALIAAARGHGATANDPVSVFATLRQWKNDFR